MVAAVGGLGCNPALSTEILTPPPLDPAGEGTRSSPGPWDDLNLTIRADRQYADLQQNHLVAEGSVRLHLSGGHLAAERVTYGRGTGLLTATGAVRFWRGSQYIQASTLRYNLETQKGELRDVYGVVNFDRHAADLDFRSSEVQPILQPGVVDPGDPGAELPPMACPLLQPPGPNRSMDRATMQQSLVPPLGCPNPDGHGRHHRDPDHLPASMMSGSGSTSRSPSLQGESTLEDEALLEPPEPNARRSVPVDQRVHGITSRTGLQLEYRLDFEGGDPLSETEDNEEDEGREDPVIPTAFRMLERRRMLSRARGWISQWRFQAKAIVLTPEAWTSPLVVLTNDPLTPAQLILEGRDSQVREQSDGSLVLTSTTNRGLLDGRMSMPLPRRIVLGNDQPSWAFLGDENRRDGLYIERILPPRPFLGAS